MVTMDINDAFALRLAKPLLAHSSTQMHSAISSSLLKLFTATIDAFLLQFPSEKQLQEKITLAKITALDNFVAHLKPVTREDYSGKNYLP